jgi:integrase
MSWIESRRGWMKDYKGKRYAISCKQLGADPSKGGSWKAANDWWEAKQNELSQAEAPKLTLPQRRWEQIAQWCDTNKPEDAGMFRKTAASEEESRTRWDSLDDAAKAVWMDRLRLSGIFYKSEHLPAAKQVSLESLVQTFLDGKKIEAEAGEISLGRWDNLRRYLTQWQSHFEGTNPALLNGVQIEQYRHVLLQKIKNKKLSQETAKGAISAIKSFYKWAWKKDVFEQLPKDFDDYGITVDKVKVKTVEIDKVKLLLSKATDREKLWFLLMLGCGYTQADISSLKQDEVDWGKGTITRKRTKTKRQEYVPTVTYTLWRETFRLLKIFRQPKGDLVLLNEDGKPLKNQRIKDDGKYTKNDNIASAYFKLCKKENLTHFPLKRFRNTSNTLLSYSDKYSQFADLFLGHSPRGINQVNYLGDAPATFADAIKWLGQQYGVQ